MMVKCVRLEWLFLIGAQPAASSTSMAQQEGMQTWGPGKSFLSLGNHPFWLVKIVIAKHSGHSCSLLVQLPSHWWATEEIPSTQLGQLQLLMVKGRWENCSSHTNCRSIPRLVGLTTGSTLPTAHWWLLQPTIIITVSHQRLILKYMNSKGPTVILLILHLFGPNNCHLHLWKDTTWECRFQVIPKVWSLKLEISLSLTTLYIICCQQQKQYEETL